MPWCARRWPSLRIVAAARAVARAAGVQTLVAGRAIGAAAPTAPMATHAPSTAAIGAATTFQRTVTTGTSAPTTRATHLQGRVRTRRIVPTFAVLRIRRTFAGGQGTRSVAMTPATSTTAAGRARPAVGRAAVRHRGRTAVTPPPGCVVRARRTAVTDTAVRDARRPAAPEVGVKASAAGRRAAA